MTIVASCYLAIQARCVHCQQQSQKLRHTGQRGRMYLQIAAEPPTRPLLHSAPLCPTERL